MGLPFSFSFPRPPAVRTSPDRYNARRVTDFPNWPVEPVLMGLPFVRPRVADLVFRLYDRPLHPELFDTLAVRRVDHAGDRLIVRITRAGHALTWVRGAACLTEATAGASEELPARGRLAHRIGGERHGQCQIAPGVRYQVGMQVEVLPPEQFLHVHEELRADATRKGMAFHFRPHHRLGLSPLGLVIVEALAGCLSVSAFHTFPDELAIVKTQSLIEWV